MHLDTLTEDHSRLSFARICIEVDVNCTFPKSALLDLGNGKYSTIRIEYPWVPQNCTHCKIFGHSQVKCQGVKDMVDTGKTTGLDHIDMRPAQDFVDNADSSPVSRAVKAAEDIDSPITTPGKVGNVKVTDIQGRLTGNTFECLTICDDVTPRIPVRPDWRIVTGFRDARPCTGTLYLKFFFFFKSQLAPVGMAHIL